MAPRAALAVCTETLFARRLWRPRLAVGASQWGGGVVGGGSEGGGVLAWALAAAASRGSARDPGPHQHLPSAYLPWAYAYLPNFPRAVPDLQDHRRQEVHRDRAQG